MNALRLIFEKPPRELRIPDEFLAHPLEVIIMRLGDAEKPVAAGNCSSNLGDFAGRWCGTSLVRECEGESEVRYELQ